MTKNQAEVVLQNMLFIDSERDCPFRDVKCGQACAMYVGPQIRHDGSGHYVTDFKCRATPDNRDLLIDIHDMLVTINNKLSSKNH